MRSLQSVVAAVVVVILAGVVLAQESAQPVKPAEPKGEMAKPAPQPDATAAKVKKLISDGGYAYHLKRFQEAHNLADQALALDPQNRAALELKRMSVEALNGLSEENWGRAQAVANQEEFQRIREMNMPEQEILKPAPDQNLLQRRQGQGVLGPAGELEIANRPIEEKLDRTVSVDFQAVSLGKAAEFLSALGGVNVLVDPNATFGQTKVAGAPVTLAAKEMKLRNVLSWICRDLGLAWTVRDQAVYITTKEGLRPLMVTGVFDVQDIVSPVPDFDSEAYFNLNLRPVDVRALFDWYQRDPYWYYQEFRGPYGPFPFGSPYAADTDAVDRYFLTQPELERMIDKLIDEEDAR